MDSFDAELWIEKARKLGWEYVLADDGALYFRPRNGMQPPGALADAGTTGQREGWIELAPGNGTVPAANAAAVKQRLAGNGSPADIAGRWVAEPRGKNGNGK